MPLSFRFKRRALRAHQRDALARFRGAPSAFFAMDMRLGKTLTCIRWILENPKARAGRVVIVAPKTVLIPWEEELKAERIHFITLRGSSASKTAGLLFAGPGSFVLVNYEAFLSLDFVRTLEKIPPSCLVLDESTRIKGHKSKTTQNLLRVCDLVPFKACLSGLPSPQSLEDLWPQMAFLGDGRWMGCSGFYRWRARHTVPDLLSHGAHGIEFPPGEAAKVRAEFQAQAFCLTRKQAEEEYGLAMPEKIYGTRWGELSKPERKAYSFITSKMECPPGPFQALSKRWREYQEEGTPDPLQIASEADHQIVTLSWLRRLPGFLPTSWKYAELLDIIRDLGADKGREKLAVWFAFTQEIIQAQKILEQNGIPARALLGETPDKERRRTLSDFNAGLDILLVQQKLGQFGLNLSTASTAVYFSNSYNLEERAQSEDRIFLPGKRNLLILDLLTRGTIDEEIREILTTKRHISARTLARQVLGKH